VDEPLSKEWVVRDHNKETELSNFATSFGGRFIDKTDRTATLSMLNIKRKISTRANSRDKLIQKKLAP